MIWHIIRYKIFLVLDCRYSSMVEHLVDMFETLESVLFSVFSIFLKIDNKGNLWNSFIQSQYFTNTRAEKKNTQKGNNKPFSLMNIEANILSKMITNLFQYQIKKITHNDEVGFITMMKKLFKIYTSISGCFLVIRIISPKP